MKAPTLRAEGLRFAYPGGFALHLAEWEVRAGEAVALFGPSGSGKSTLLGLFAGALRPTGGHLAVLGQAMEALSPGEARALRLRRMGVVFQDHPLVESLSAKENVLLPYHLGAGPLGPEEERRAEGLLARLGLGDASARPGALSQGERQRVAIARALVTRPALILADEPTAGLDRPRAEGVCDLLLSLCAEEGASLVFVTHDEGLLERFPRRLDAETLKEGGR